MDFNKELLVRNSNVYSISSVFATARVFHSGIDALRNTGVYVKDTCWEYAAIAVDNAAFERSH